ncbi:MAG: transglutaminase-like domain-containing protein [Candidatus Woesebacteria bacterium]
MSRFLFIILIGIVGIIWLPQIAQASNFSTSLESTYDVTNEGKATVTHEFSIENGLSTQYITDYAFEAAGNQLKNVSVVSNGKKIEPTLTASKNKTNISFSFPDKVVGTGQHRTFTVTYESADVATRIGKVVEVSIPKLSQTSQFFSYSVNIRVPSILGTPINSQPKVFTTSTDNNKMTLHFKDLTDHTGVSVIFGKEQYASLHLTYHLENTSTSKGLMQIALPADGVYQSVWYDSIDPLPKSIHTDTDGNWIGTYELDPNQKISVDTKLSVHMQSTPQENALILSKKPENIYTQAQPFWPTSNPQISKLALQLQTPKAIYDYVVRTLHYKYEKADEQSIRLGADGALATPSESLCTEFTDLFVALARSAHIPARAVLGYAYTQNKDLRPIGFSTDILHTWPQYWDDTTAQWISVDPTWENTTGGMDYFHTIDFNRLIFAIQGASSTAPLPAGMYKFSDENSKDVEVTYTESMPVYPDSFESTLQLHPRSLLGFSDRYGIQIKNTALHAVYGVPLTIKIQNQGGMTTSESKISLIPREEREIPVQLPRTGFFINGPSTITVTIGGKQFTHEITFKNTIQQIAPLLTILALVASSIGLCAFISRRLLVPRWKR